MYSFNSVVISNGYDTPEDVLRYLKNYIPEVTIEIAALFVGRSRYSAMFVEHYISSLPRGNSLGTTALEYFNRAVSVMMEAIKNLPSKYPNLAEELKSLENFLDDSIFNFLLVYNSNCFFYFKGRGPILIEDYLKLLFESGVGRVIVKKDTISPLIYAMTESRKNPNLQ